MAGTPFNNGFIFWVIVALAGWVAQRARRRQANAANPEPTRERQQRDLERAQRVRAAREDIAQRIAARRAQAEAETTPNWRLPRPHVPTDVGHRMTAPQPPQMKVPSDEAAEPEDQSPVVRVPVARGQDGPAVVLQSGGSASTTLLVGTAPAANLGTADAGTRPTAIAAALPAFAEESATVAAFGGLADLRGAASLRRAVVLREILGKPVGL